MINSVKHQCEEKSKRGGRIKEGANVPKNHMKRQIQGRIRRTGKADMDVIHTHNRYLSLASTALTGFPSKRSSEASCARHIRKGDRIHYSEFQRGDMSINICDAMFFVPVKEPSGGNAKLCGWARIWIHVFGDMIPGECHLVHTDATE